jgi:hypothetical protein
MGSEIALAVVVLLVVLAVAMFIWRVVDTKQSR